MLSKEDIKKNIIKKNIIKNNKIIKNKYFLNIKTPDNYYWCKTTSEYIYCILNDIKTQPLCENCKSQKVKFKSFSKGYNKNCSLKCSQNNPTTKQKIQSTFKKKYGVDNISQLDNIKEKKKETLIKNYNVTAALKSDIIKNKMKNTIKKKYNIDNISQLDSIKEKKKETLIKNYNVTAALKSDIIKNKMKKTIKEKYGVDNISQLDNIKEKKIQTYQKKYNNDNPFQNEKIKNIIKNTNLKKYGTEYPLQNKDILKKVQNTNLKKYNNVCSLQSIKQKEKRKKEIYNQMIFKLKQFDLQLNCNIENYKGTFKDYKNKNITNYIYYNFTCLKCGYNFDGHLVDGNIPICRKCHPMITGTSLAEKEIFEYCKEICNNKQFKIFTNVKNIINPLELDIYIEIFKDDKLIKKIAIEYNGLYYHSYQKLNQLKNDGSNYHLLKTEKCENQQIQLFHIFENEWLEKKDIIKSMIKNKLNLIENKLNARNCIIKIVNFNNTKEFLNKNHIQGYCNSKINLGLYHNDKLVSIMTFSKKRFFSKNKNLNKNNEYELLRFANLKETLIRGAASKLLKYFIKNYTNKNDLIITYADKRYSTGKLYNTLGFKYIHTTKPNYKYFKNLKVYNRQKFQKKKIKEYYDIYINNKYKSVNYGLIKKYNKNLTEYENMLLNSYDKIFDSGQMKFQKII